MNPEPPKPPEAPQLTRGEQSAQRDGAFSKPGTTKSSSGWKPAKGTRFRATAEKAPGRPRKRPRDKRNVQFF